MINVARISTIRAFEPGKSHNPKLSEARRSNHPKPLSGIETCQQQEPYLQRCSPNHPKPLSGIELTPGLEAWG